MKKSAIAAVAASNLSIFSGLVNAAEMKYHQGNVGVKGMPCLVINHNCAPAQVNPGGAIIPFACDCEDVYSSTIIINGAICDDAQGTNPRCR